MPIRQAVQAACLGGDLRIVGDRRHRPGLEAEPRQILAGIAEHYEPETLIGRKVAIVANLKPRKLRGFESQGMVLAASVGDEGKPVLATFIEDVPNGARLK